MDKLATSTILRQRYGLGFHKEVLWAGRECVYRNEYWNMVEEYTDMFVSVLL